MTPSPHRLVAAIVLVGLVCADLSSNSAGDGLTQLRTETRSTGPFEPPANWSQPKAADPEPYQDPSSFSDYADDDVESGFVAAIAIGTIVVASAPFWGPAKLVGDDYSSAAFFPRYPYQQPVDGYLMIEPYVPRKPREWSGRAMVESGGDFDDVTTWTGGLVFESTSRFGIDSTTRYFSEETTTGADDHIWVGDANLIFRFAQSPKLEMRTGIGLNWLDDSIGSDFGFNFTYAGDWYPMSPFIVSSELDWGEIGHASLFHIRMTAGVQWHRAEIYAGYDYLDVGNAQLDTWIAGVRFWF